MARRSGAKTTGYFGMAASLAQTCRAKRARRSGACARNAGILRGTGRSAVRLTGSGSRLPASSSQLPASSSGLRAPGSRLQAPGSRLRAPGSGLRAPGSGLRARLGSDADADPDADPDPDPGSGSGSGSGSARRCSALRAASGLIACHIIRPPVGAWRPRPARPTPRTRMRRDGSRRRPSDGVRAAGRPAGTCSAAARRPKPRAPR